MNALSRTLPVFSRLLPLLFLPLVTLTGLLAQADYANSQLEYGDHPIGFLHFTKTDSTRVYRRLDDFTEKLQYREMHISTWYPATRPEANQVQVDDYLQVLKEEEEWENLPDSFVLDWFYYPRNTITERNRDYPTQAFASAVPATGKYPVIIYSPSYNAASTENFMLCEYLASNGYLVLAAPSNGAQNRELTGGTGADAGAQHRDLDYLFGYAGSLPHADMSRVYTIGFSFGGLSNVPFAMSNRFVDGVISLDGTIKYNLPAAAALPQFDVERMRIPFVHFSQKPIPEAVLQEENIDPGLSENFVFLDSLRSAPAYEFRSPNLTHGQFASFGMLFEPRDERQDRAEPLIHRAYADLCTAVLYTLRHMEDYATTGDWDDPAYQKLITERDHQLVRKASAPAPSPLGVNDFFDSVRTVGFDKMDSVYVTFVALSENFEVPEYALNKLGLQLGLSKLVSTHADGLAVLDFAVSVYPESANLHDSLATVCLEQGLKDRARHHYQRSVDLFPGNEYAKGQLLKLGVE